MDAAPSPFVEATSLLAYPVGLRFLIGPWLAEGQPAIDRFYETPLLSFRQWAFASAGQPLGESPLTCFPTVPPPGFTAFDHDRLGTAGLIGLRAWSGHGSSVAFQAGAMLLDDSVVVFTSAADPAAVAVAWRLRFVGPTSAFQSLDPAEPVSRARVIGDELLILRATDPALLDAWTTAADCGRAEDLPVPPEQLEKPSALVRRLLR
jgi:hypothetical protein